jgi:hypothetical protein
VDGEGGEGVPIDDMSSGGFYGDHLSVFNEFETGDVLRTMQTSALFTPSAVDIKSTCWNVKDNSYIFLENKLKL